MKQYFIFFLKTFESALTWYLIYVINKTYKSVEKLYLKITFKVYMYLCMCVCAWHDILKIEKIKLKLIE